MTFGCGARSAGGAGGLFATLGCTSGVTLGSRALFGGGASAVGNSLNCPASAAPSTMLTTFVSKAEATSPGLITSLSGSNTGGGALPAREIAGARTAEVSSELSTGGEALLLSLIHI